MLHKLVYSLLIVYLATLGGTITPPGADTPEFYLVSSSSQNASNLLVCISYIVFSYTEILHDTPQSLSVQMVELGDTPLWQGADLSEHSISPKAISLPLQTLVPTLLKG